MSGDPIDSMARRFLMLLADTMTWFFVITGLLVALPGLWLLCRGLWPGAVERTTKDCARGLIIPLLVGIPIAAITVVTVGRLTKLPGPWNGILSIADASAFLLFASAGIAGLATSIGQKLPSPTDADRPWKATIRGGIVLELAFLVPLLGWFVLLPLSIIIGAGSALRAVIGTIRDNSKGKRIEVAPAPPAADVQLDGGTLGAAT
jgi:hypothetical protein